MPRTNHWTLPVSTPHRLKDCVEFMANLPQQLQGAAGVPPTEHREEVVGSPRRSGGISRSGEACFVRVAKTRAVPRFREAEGYALERAEATSRWLSLALHYFSEGYIHGGQTFGGGRITAGQQGDEVVALRQKGLHGLALRGGKDAGRRSRLGV